MVFSASLTRATYDDNYNLTGLFRPDAARTLFGYDRKGNTSGSRIPSGRSSLGFLEARCRCNLVIHEASQNQTF